MPQTERIFYVIDLDRCLADTDKLFALFEQIIYEQTDITEETLQKARQKTEQTGGSFDVISYLQERLQADTMTNLQELFVKEGKKQDLFEPGARDLLQFLTDNSLPFGILTYGGKTWQQMKLQAMDLDALPYIITDIQAKGKIIASWKQPDGKFLIPSELHRESNLFEGILLVDDKFLSFEGLPEGASGIRVLAKNAPFSNNPLPDNVVQAEGMSEVKILIKSRFRL